MNWLALLVLGTAGAIVTAACLLFLFIRHRFQLRHRVDPSVPTDAPASWVADPRAPARLHRRLVRIGALTGAIAAEHRPPPRPRAGRVTRSRRTGQVADTDPIHEAAVEVRAQAVALDARLARLSLLPAAARRDDLRQLGDQVAQLERTCTRLVQLDADASSSARLPGDGHDLTVVRQVDLLADAHRELLALDHESGLEPERTVVQPATDRPTQVLPTPPPPPPRPARARRPAG